MKPLKIILLSILGLIVIAVIGGLIFLGIIKNGALPEYSGELTVAGLNNEVTVFRDERGMPHIYANNEHDLYFTTGYIMAQERLWQMDLIRRATTGRLSEIFGEDYITTDLFLRSLDMTNKSKMVLSETDAEILSCIQSFADGVNQYIMDAGRKLPPEFRILSYKPDPWKLEDLANIIGYMGWDLASGNLSSDIFYYKLNKKVGQEKAAGLIPDFKAEKNYVFPDFKPGDKALTSAEEMINSMEKLRALGIVSFSGSNNWAVSGRKSVTGKPILSNDMHLELNSPGIWIQMHQVIPGKLNVTGVIVPGQPFVVAGHNERIAWGMTNLMVDDIDLFEEKINPSDPGQYLFNGEWKKMSVRDEVIKIKGGSDTTMQIKFTHRGPVISGFRNIDDAVLSMRWSGYDMSNEIRSVYLLNRASGIEDFRSALGSFRSVSQNFIYADVEGNIGLNTGGGIAIRKGHGSIIRPGESDEYDWKGYVPFELLPSSYNPDTGYVSSANNKTVDENYPWYISSGFAMPYRINRIRQMLGEKQVFDLDDFKRMVNDQHSDYAALLTPFILKAMETAGQISPSELYALNSMKEWDYEMNKDLAAPSVFEFFRIAFARNLLSDELGELYNEIDGTARDYYIYRILTDSPDSWVDNIRTTTVESLNDIIVMSFRDCIADISESVSPDTLSWKWGDIHKITLAHPLGSVKLLDRLFGFNSDEYRIGGSSHTVSPYSYGSGFKVDHGASERHIFNTANWDDSFTIIPTGISGVPASEFYLSQTKTYLEGGFYRDHFSEEAVKANAKYILKLKSQGN